MSDLDFYNEGFGEVFEEVVPGDQYRMNEAFAAICGDHRNPWPLGYEVAESLLRAVNASGNAYCEF
jgi:hypothetical protein